MMLHHNCWTINVSSFASVWKTAHALTETSKKSTDLKEIMATQSALKLSRQATANRVNQRKGECIRQIEQLKDEVDVFDAYLAHQLPAFDADVLFLV